MGKTLFDKLWDRHVVHGEEGSPQLLYIDLHLIHEVTSPQAFAGIREAVEHCVILSGRLRRWIIIHRLSIFLISLT